MSEKNKVKETEAKRMISQNVGNSCKRVWDDKGARLLRASLSSQRKRRESNAEHVQNVLESWESHAKSVPAFLECQVSGLLEVHLCPHL